MVDLPGDRRIHTEIIPRMGGILIFLAASIVIILFESDMNSIRLLIISSGLIFLIGFFDDTLGLSCQFKLWMELLTSILIVYFFRDRFSDVMLLGMVIPAPLDYIVLILFIAGSINSINFLDGVDGLVVGTSLMNFSILLLLAILYNNILIILLTISLLGGILGFLKYNVATAKIFLGDTGSLTIGFFLVFASLNIATKNNIIDLTFPAILLSVPIADAFRVIVERIRRRQNPFLPDMTHIHHLIIEATGSKRAAVLTIEILTIISGVLSLNYIQGTHVLTGIIFIFLCSLLVSIRFLLSFMGRKILTKEKIKSIMILWRVRLHKLRKLMLYVTSLILVVIMINSMTLKNYMDQGLVLYFVIAGLIVLATSFVLIRTQKNGYDFFILLNITAYLVIANFTEISHDRIFHSFQNLTGFPEIGFYILVTLIMLFLLANDSAVPSEAKENSLDFNLVLLLILALFVNYTIPAFMSTQFRIVFLEFLIIYIWLKTVSSSNHKIKSSILYASFILCFVIVLKLLII
ncbi:MAG: glycosyltransferase family 4 protein [Methanococcaceae archaeon]